MALLGGFHNRFQGDKPKGIGWQFIRFIVLTISVPTVGLLALNNALTGEAAALIGGAWATPSVRKMKAASEVRRSSHPTAVTKKSHTGSRTDGIKARAKMPTIWAAMSSCR